MTPACGEVVVFCGEVDLSCGRHAVAVPIEKFLWLKGLCDRVRAGRNCFTHFRKEERDRTENEDSAGGATRRASR
jgi:hypothetical protein